MGHQICVTEEGLSPKKDGGTQKREGREGKWREELERWCKPSARMQGESAREISQGQEEGYFRKEMFRVVKSMDPGARLHGFES